MPAFGKFNLSGLGPKTDDKSATVTTAEPVNDEETANVPDKTTADDGSVVSETVQHGVANQQAITLSWNKKSLAFMFIKYGSLAVLCLLIHH